MLMIYTNARTAPTLEAIAFWTYLEGRRMYVTERFARMEVANGTARIVEVK